MVTNQVIYPVMHFGRGSVLIWNVCNLLCNNVINSSVEQCLKVFFHFTNELTKSALYGIHYIVRRE